MYRITEITTFLSIFVVLFHFDDLTILFNGCLLLEFKEIIKLHDFLQDFTLSIST